MARLQSVASPLRRPFSRSGTVTAQAPAETGGNRLRRKPAESAAAFQAVSGGLTINAIFGNATIANDPNAAAIEARNQ